MGVAFCGTLNCLDLGVATPVVRVRELIQPRSPPPCPITERGGSRVVGVDRKSSRRA
jgi:hypothetical protein